MCAHPFPLHAVGAVRVPPLPHRQPVLPPLQSGLAKQCFGVLERSTVLQIAFPLSREMASFGGNIDGVEETEGMLEFGESGMISSRIHVLIPRD